MEYSSNWYQLWLKTEDVLKIVLPSILILLYTLYFLLFEIYPEGLESIVSLVGLKWIYPQALFLPLVIGLYFYLFSITYIVNISVNKYIYHSPNPMTGLVLPKKFHTIAIIFLNLSIFVLGTLCIYVMSSVSGCGLHFIDGETPTGICLLTNLTSSITVSLVPLFIIAPFYLWSMRFLLRKVLSMVA